MSEKVGKHKGAVETLLHEKKELSRLLQIVNSQLQRHLTALEEEGIDPEEYLKQVQEENTERQQKRQQNAGRNKQQSENSQESSGGPDDSEMSLQDELEPEDRDFNPHK